MTRYKWATDYADKLDDLQAQRDALSAELSARECGDLFARWGAGVAGRGVLRNSDKLSIELCYPSAEFSTHSSGAYCRGVHYVIVHRNGATSRATLRVNGDVRAVGGELSYFVDDDGAVRVPSCCTTSIWGRRRRIWRATRSVCSGSSIMRTRRSKSASA